MTSTVTDILKLAHSLNIRITINGDGLRLNAPTKPPDEVLDQLRVWKPEIIRELTKQCRKSTPVTRQVISFSLDNTPKRITAIDMEATDQQEALERLFYAWGSRLTRAWDRAGKVIWEYPSNQK